MPLKHYGVLKGRAISTRLGFGASPHYQIHVVDNLTDYRIAINVKSALSPSELLYLVDDDFRHPATESLKSLKVGFTQIAGAPGGVALDFIRGNLFDRSRMRALPHDVPGPDNDLNEKIDIHVTRALQHEDAQIYAFGERWGPEAHKKDKYFGFLPGNGIHDIHMNQGNSGQFVSDDGVWQDGGLLLHFPETLAPDGEPIWPEKWVAVFLAFQSQAWHTDDKTGHTIVAPQPTPTPTPTPIPVPGDRDGLVRIVGALVNPSGDDVGKETVTLLNASPQPVSLAGWALLDRNEKAAKLSGPTLPAGATHCVVLTGKDAQLGNDGGIITLIDPQGLKVDGVSFTREQAKKQGWTVVF